MATVLNVARGDLGVVDQVLAAGVPTNVVFPQEIEEAEILSDGSAAVYVCTTGDDAAVSGPRTRPLPAGSVSSLVVPVNGRVVSVVSAGTPKFSVTVA